MRFRITHALTISIALVLTTMATEIAPHEDPNHVAHPDHPEHEFHYEHEEDELAALGGKSKDVRDQYSVMRDKIAGMPDIEDNYVDPEEKKAMMAMYGGGKLLVSADAIEPEGGPITGDTRVLVRGGPFGRLSAIFPKPKCRFGKSDRTVAANYVTCSTSPRRPGEAEARKRQKNDTCLQCDNSPEVENPEIIPFTISLTGDFSDAANSVPYRYYKPVSIPH